MCYGKIVNFRAKRVHFIVDFIIFLYQDAMSVICNLFNGHTLTLGMLMTCSISSISSDEPLD